MRISDWSSDVCSSDLLDLLGLEGRLFRCRGGRPRLLRRDALYAGTPDGRAELAAVVQHRAALGLRHRRPESGPPLRRLLDRQADALRQRLRAPAAARLLHPRPDEHTSELQSLMRISYAVFFLKKKQN